jgi:hypothetical protein
MAQAQAQAQAKAQETKALKGEQQQCPSEKLIL